MIEARRPIHERTVLAVIAAATLMGAVACPAFSRTGRADEVHLFQGGQVQASIFRPAKGRLGVWRVNGSEAEAATAVEAVQIALAHPSPGKAVEARRGRQAVG